MQFDRDKFKALVHYVIWRAGGRDGIGATKLYKVLWFAEARAFVLSNRPISGETYIREEDGPSPRHAAEITHELESEGAIRPWSDQQSPMRRFTALRAPDASMLIDDHRKIIEYWIARVDADRTAISTGEASHDAAWEIATPGEELPYIALLATRIREPRGKELEWAKSRTEDFGTV